MDGDPDRFAEPDIDSFARYLDLNEAFHSEIVALVEEFHAAARVGAGELSPVRIAQRAGVRARETPPRARRCLPFLTSTTAPSSRPSSSGKAPAPKPLAREHSRMTRRNVEFALSDTSILSGVPGASLIRIPAAV